MKALLGRQKIREAAVSRNSVFIYAYNFYQGALSVSRFGTHVVVTMGANVLQSVLALLTGVMVARLLGPAGRGDLAAIQNWGSFIASLASYGLHESAVYFSARRPEDGGRYWVSATGAALIVAVPFALVGYWLLPWLMPTQSVNVVLMARVYLLVLIPLFAFYGMPLDVLRGRRDFLTWNVLQFLPTLGWLLLLLSALFLESTTPVFLAYGYLAIHGSLFLVIAVVAASRIGGPFRLDVRLWPSLIRYGLPLTAAAVPAYCMQSGRIAQLLLLAFLDSQSVGLFVVAIAYSSMVTPLSHVVATVAFPYISAQSTDNERGKLLTQCLPITALLIIVLSMGLFLLAPLLLPLLFGGEFQAAIPAAMVMVLSGALSGVAKILEDGLRGFGKPGVILVGQTVSLGVTTLCIGLLVRPLGIVGGGVGMVMGALTLLGYFLLQMQRLADLPLHRLMIPTTGEITGAWHSFANLIAGRPRMGKDSL